MVHDPRFETRAEAGPISESRILGTTLSLENVYDRSYSHNHLAAANPDIADDVLEYVLSLVDTKEQSFLVAEIDCGDRYSLLTQCVETTEADEIVYAHRLDRPGPTRFVLDRSPQPTTFVRVILARSKDPRRQAELTLISAMAGQGAQPEPWDQHISGEAEMMASQAFWSTHALIWDGQDIDFTRPFGRARPDSYPLE